MNHCVHSNESNLERLQSAFVNIFHPSNQDNRRNCQKTSSRDTFVCARDSGGKRGNEGRSRHNNIRKNNQAGQMIALSPLPLSSSGSIAYHLNPFRLQLRLLRNFVLCNKFIFAWNVSIFNFLNEQSFPSIHVWSQIYKLLCRIAKFICLAYKMTLGICEISAFRTLDWRWNFTLARVLPSFCGFVIKNKWMKVIARIADKFCVGKLQ